MTPDPTNPETDAALHRLADAFLRWPLPDTVCADLCATDTKYKNRVGTNLLSYTEAKEMFRALVLPELDAHMAELARLREERDQWKSCAERTDAKMLHEQADHNKTVDRLIEARATIARLESELKGLQRRCSELKGLLSDAVDRRDREISEIKAVLSSTYATLKSVREHIECEDWQGTCGCVVRGTCKCKNEHDEFLSIIDTALKLAARTPPNPNATQP